MLLRGPPPRDSTAHAKPVVSPDRRVVTLHARTAMAGSTAPQLETGAPCALPPAAPSGSGTAVMPATPVAQSVQLYEKRIAFTRWRAAIKAELPGFAALRLCPAPGNFAGSGTAYALPSKPDGAPDSCAVAGPSSYSAPAARAAQRACAAGDADLMLQQPPGPALPPSTGGRAGAGAPHTGEVRAGQRAAEGPSASSAAESTEQLLLEQHIGAPEAEQPAARPARWPARGPAEQEVGKGGPPEGPCDAGAAGLGALTAAAGEAGEEGSSLAQAALALFGDPALAARCQAALRGTDPAALAALAADSGSALAAQHTIAALTDAVRQLGGSLEAVLGQQQRFLLAAAAWAAREAVQRREAQAHSAAAAAELLHARNVLAEALGREQGLRDKCEALSAEVAALRGRGVQQSVQCGRALRRPAPAEPPAAVKEEVHLSHSAWLAFLRSDD